MTNRQIKNIQEHLIHIKTLAGKAKIDDNAHIGDMLGLIDYTNSILIDIEGACIYLLENTLKTNKDSHDEH